MMKVTNLEELHIRMAQIREAQKQFATYSQAQVDEIFRQASKAANQARISLAKMAVAETGMGIVEDKVIKVIIWMRRRDDDQEEVGRGCSSCEGHGSRSALAFRLASA